MFYDSYRRVICSAAFAVLALASCGGGDDGGADEAESTTTTEATTVEIELLLVTTNGLIGGNVDDVSCEWGTVGYEVVDRNEDDVLDIGDISGNGRVMDLMPNYECQLEGAVTVPVTDFYEVTVEGEGFDSPWSATETFSVEDVEAGPILFVING